MPMNMKKTKEEIQWEMIQKRFLAYDQEKMIRIFALTHDEESIFIDFMGRTYRIDRKTGLMYDGGRQASIDETVSVYELLTNSEHAPYLSGKWESIASLCTNTTDTSLGRYIDYLKPFKDDTELMQKTLLKMGAEPASKGDASAILTVYPNVPVWFQYWAADDEFPASIQFLFDREITEHFRWSLLWNLMTMITDRMLETAGLKSAETAGAKLAESTGEMQVETAESNPGEASVSSAEERFAFRSIRPEETQQAIEIEQICFPPHEACSAKHMTERIAAAPDLFLAAVDRNTGKIAGFLNGIATDETVFRDEFLTDASLHQGGGQVIMLLGLDVRPAYQHQGLAHDIVRRYARRERERGRKMLVLTCLENKVSLYEQMGFTDKGLSASVWGGEAWHEMTCEL